MVTPPHPAPPGCGLCVDLFHKQLILTLAKLSIVTALSSLEAMSEGTVTCSVSNSCLDQLGGAAWRKAVLTSNRRGGRGSGNVCR